MSETQNQTSLERLKQTLNTLGKILSYIILPYTLFLRYRRYKIADECISSSGNSELIKQSNTLRRKFLTSAIVYSFISMSLIFGGAITVVSESKEPIIKVLEKQKYKKQTSTKTKKYLTKKLNTRMNYFGLALLVGGILINVAVIQFDRDAERTKQFRKFLIDKQSTEYNGTKSFYCFGGYVAFLTTHTQREVAENKALWAALGTTASVDSTLSHPTNRKIAMFRKKFELEDKYIF
ncbi:hypothetical protein [Bdellovibrio sp. BCCA]|uniref:hypothetical protein n=1 Tax=Bdellovibrio sp. BCCA TaxID=3136281 RepID=UPI0030EFEC62